jgi:protein-S-isoprenylcysteine O-methyltransferase Ste14
LSLAQWFLLVVGTGVLAGISARALTAPRSHGFHRFFGLEATLALLAINGPAWFVDRLAPRQLVSWGLLFASLALLIAALYRLRRARRDPARDDPALLGFERTGELVHSGIYAHIRHPMYASVILLAWGVMLKAPTPTAVVLALVATGFMIVTARVEERECLAHFGERYERYRGHTGMFLPRP